MLFPLVLTFAELSKWGEVLPALSLPEYLRHGKTKGQLSRHIHVVEDQGQDVVKPVMTYQFYSFSWYTLCRILSAPSCILFPGYHSFELQRNLGSPASPTEWSGSVTNAAPGSSIIFWGCRKNFSKIIIYPRLFVVQNGGGLFLCQCRQEPDGVGPGEVKASVNKGTKSRENTIAVHRRHFGRSICSDHKI